MEISRRDAGRLLVATAAVGSASGQVHAEGATSIGKMTLEWQTQPLALDTLQPRFKWTMKTQGKARGTAQSAFRLMIVDASGSPVFDTGRVTSATMAFQPASDLPLKSQTVYTYALQVWDQAGRNCGTNSGSFTTGLVTPDDNRGLWLAAAPDVAPRRAIEGQWFRVDKATPLPLFRKALAIPKPVRNAHLCITGLGQYQVWIDGNKVSPDGLNGGWTDYDKRVLYDAYDVTEHLATGDHVLGVALGNGFFNVEVLNGRYSKLDGTFGRPQMWAQLRIVYADGSEAIIASDATWLCRSGGTIYSSIYGGEDFDAGQDDGRFGGLGWAPATVIKGPAGYLQASTFRPMALRSRLKPKAVTPHPGAVIYDFGLNHSGRPSITLRNLKPGAVVRLVPSEILTGDGLANQQSMVGGTATGYRGIAFTYIARGGLVETWSPQFTYTGYRYVQVEGVDQASIDIESLFLSDDLTPTGTFECSDKRMELVHGLIRQALVSNSASVLTDCPTREKLGWLEQIYLNAATAMMNSDMVRVYEKMAADIRDAQEPTGEIPTIAPEFTKFLDRTGKDTKFRDSPEWGAALILGAWSVYRLHGDLGILKPNYEAMQRRVAFLETRLGADGLLDYGLGDWYDLGPKNPGVAQLTSRKMTGTATFHAELTTLSQIARKLGLSDADTYASRAKALRETILGKLFDPSRSTLDTGSQTAQAMGLVVGLFPDDHRAKALAVLVDDVRAHQDHPTAGDIGFHYVVRALTEGGRSDLLYDMLKRTDKPAYLDQVKNGATALTEGWDSWQQGSQNHFMLGHAEIWLYGGLGGLDIDLSREIGQIVLAPQPVEGVTEQAARYDGVFGLVGSRLRRDGRRWQLNADIPPGRTATIVLPKADPARVREGTLPLAKADGVAEAKSINGDTIVAVQSGRYEFTWLK